MIDSKKQISFFIPFAHWELLRRLSALERRPVTELVVENIPWKKIERRLAKKLKARAEE